MTSSAWITFGALLISQNPNWPPDLTNTPEVALELVENMPGDPDFYDPDKCQGQLELLGFVPECAENVHESQKALGFGLHVDRAWVFTTGNPKIKFGVLGNRLNWNDLELVSQWALNSAELPAPVTSTSASNDVHDLNRDGAFTVLDYTSATGTTAPNIELVIDQWLLSREDRGDANQNGYLDPEDLIVIFSDGIDDDQNGKVDDICGWDFIENDQNAGTSSIAWDSNTGKHDFVRTMVALTNNGIGGAGVCPDCKALPVRIFNSDSMQTANLVNGLRYAASAGADIIPILKLPQRLNQQEELEIEQVSKELADKNILIVVSAGTEFRADFEQPALYDHALVLGEITTDHSEATKVSDLYRRNPCANFGPQIDVVAPGNCGELAPALAAGTAGLVLSVAQGIRQIGVEALQPPLRTAELKQILRTSAEKKPLQDKEEELNRLTRFQTVYGYGRINARAAVEAVVQRNIAPMVSIVTPAPFSHVDPTFGEAFMVSARVENTRHEIAEWTLEYALGVDTAPEDFQPVGRGSIRANEAIDVVGEIPSNALFSDPTAPPLDEFTHAVTIRISTSANVGGSVTRSEARRIVFVQRDLYSLPPFPQQLETPPANAGLLIDLDGDGIDEIIVIDQSGLLHALDANADTLAGWPTPSMVSGNKLQLSFGKLSDEQGNVFIITGNDGATDVIDVQGNRVDGFPVKPETAENERFSYPTIIFDLDQDGSNELIVAGEDGHIMAWDSQAQVVNGFPLELEQAISPLAAGMLGAGKMPGLVGLSHSVLFLINKAQNDRFDVTLRYPLEQENTITSQTPRPNGPVIADLDKDGVEDILFVDASGIVRQFEPQTETLSRRSSNSREDFGTGSPLAREGDDLFGTEGQSSLGDLDRDGKLDLIHPASTRNFRNRVFEGPLLNNEFAMASWSTQDGSYSRGFPFSVLAKPKRAVQVFDLDRDRRPEVIFEDGRFRLQARSNAGVSPKAWPKRLDGPLMGAISIGDLEGDGVQEILATTVPGTLFVWRTSMQEDSLLNWPYPRHDLQATGNYETALPSTRAGQTTASCTCQSIDSRTPAGLQLNWFEVLLLSTLFIAGFRRSWLRVFHERPKIH